MPDDQVTLQACRAEDLSGVAELMNRAYRGAEGWCTESAYITGERATSAQLAADLAANPDARLLVHRAGGEIAATVWLEPSGGGVWYLGALTVHPALQDAGLGRRLLRAAETWASERGARQIRMTVVNVRDTLIAWYERRGYRLTDATEPWLYGDDRFGTPLRPDLHFVVLEKTLETPSPDSLGADTDMPGVADVVLFSYGTLQQANVQMALFGRILNGSPDGLAGYRLGEVDILDPDVLASSGLQRHAIITPSSEPTPPVPGAALLITPAELEAADRYETADYRRVRVTLVSGREAWAYVQA